MEDLSCDFGGDEETAFSDFVAHRNPLLLGSQPSFVRDARIHMQPRMLRNRPDTPQLHPDHIRIRLSDIAP